MNISYLFKYLWKKKWLIIVPTLIAIVLAWIFTLNQDQGYTSVAELSTGYMDQNLLDNAQRVNKTVLFNNVIQTLQSNQVLDQVSYKLLLHDLSGDVPFRKIDDKSALDQIIDKYPGGKAGLILSLSHKIDSFYILNLAVNTDRLIRKLADLYEYSPDALMGNTQILRIEGSDFIKIVSTTENPNLSAFIPNEICKGFLLLYQNEQGAASTTSLDTLKSLVETKKKLLDNKLNLLQKGNELNVSNPDQMLSMLRAQLIQQKNNLIGAQVALANVNKQISEADKSGGLANNEDIISLRNNMDNLYARYVNGGSKDQNLLDQIDKLRSELQQKLSIAGNSTGHIPMSDLQKQKTDLEVKANVAKQTINDLQGKVNILESSVQSSVAQQGMIQGIQSEIEVARQQYMQANNLYNEALNQNRFPGNDFKQVLQASPPLSADPSKKIKIIGFAGVGVFCVLVFVLLFFEFIDPAIKAPSYLKETIPLPLLANLKRINMKDLPVENVFSANGSLPDYKKGFREQIKQLRYEVESSEDRIFLVTGYHSEAGRTTLVQSLASSLSLNDRKILLIDTNFHNNSLTRKYNAEASLETFEPIGDHDTVNQKINNIATSTEDENIKVIGCGSGDHTPEEILPENNLLTWLKKNTSDHDYILIDCAALDKGPDCKELLKHAESVILLFAADQPLTEEDKKFVAFLKKNNFHILGAVLNRVNDYSLDI